MKRLLRSIDAHHYGRYWMKIVGSVLLQEKKKSWSLNIIISGELIEEMLWCSLFYLPIWGEHCILVWQYRSPCGKMLSAALHNHRVLLNNKNGKDISSIHLLACTEWGRKSSSLLFSLILSSLWRIINYLSVNYLIYIYADWHLYGCARMEIWAPLLCSTHTCCLTVQHKSHLKKKTNKMCQQREERTVKSFFLPIYKINSSPAAHMVYSHSYELLSSQCFLHLHLLFSAVGNENGSKICKSRD